MHSKLEKNIPLFLKMSIKQGKINIISNFLSRNKLFLSKEFKHLESKKEKY